MWQYLWPIFWAASFILAVANVCVSLKGKEKACISLLTGSLVCALFAMLAEYALVNAWVFKEDWAALVDVVPGMFNILTVAVLLCTALNAVSVIILLGKRGNK